MDQLGEVLRCWRIQHEIGIREAAQIIGVSSATLSRVERGKPSDAKTLNRILHWLLWS